MLSDTEQLRELLSHFFPDLVIDGVANKSGQRVVYFCHFTGSGLAAQEEVPWLHWGTVVMKVSAGIDLVTIAYMQMEIEVLNSLNSQYFPQLYWNDVFTEDPTTDEKLAERLFISIETYIDSTPLSLCRARFNTEPEVIKLLIDLIDGGSLLWLHDRRLVHRDLKPDNILIRPSGAAVIIDLGILRETGAEGVTQFMGPMTIHYASPEQAQYDKKAISFKTDLFSLATIAYELITGSNPYVTNSANNGHEILSNIISLVPPGLDELGLTSSEFANIIRRMMEKQPYKRYRAISSLRDDLFAALRRHQ